MGWIKDLWTNEEAMSLIKEAMPVRFLNVWYDAPCGQKRCRDCAQIQLAANKYSSNSYWEIDPKTLEKVEMLGIPKPRLGEKRVKIDGEVKNSIKLYRQQLEKMHSHLESNLGENHTLVKQYSTFKSRMFSALDKLDSAYKDDFIISCLNNIHKIKDSDPIRTMNKNTQNHERSDLDIDETHFPEEFVVNLDQKAREASIKKSEIKRDRPVWVINPPCGRNNCIKCGESFLKIHTVLDSLTSSGVRVPDVEGISVPRDLDLNQRRVFTDAIDEEFKKFVSHGIINKTNISNLTRAYESFKNFKDIYLNQDSYEPREYRQAFENAKFNLQNSQFFRDADPRR